MEKDNNLKCYNILMEHKARRQAKQMQTELERKQRESKSALWKAAILALLVSVIAAVTAIALAAPKETAMVETWNDGWTDSDIGETENENQQIERALYETGYFRSDIPLDGDTQAELRAACDEFGIEYTLALAVIHQETTFQNINNADGTSIGYMQVMPRWWGGLMNELGVTDLTIPYQNFRTGCAILRQMLDRYGTETRALTAYNSGQPGNSCYARKVLAYKAELDS